MLTNLVTVNQVVTPRLSAVEQLLVTFPRMIASGFTGTPGDGYGHINLQLAGSPQPCRKGYLDPDRWRRRRGPDGRPHLHEGALRVGRAVQHARLEVRPGVRLARAGPTGWRPVDVRRR